jgi:hypothetical protein
MWVTTVRNQFFLCLCAASVVCSLSGGAHADDRFVKEAKLRSARDFDKTLPDQPVEEWLRVRLPGYKTSWGEHITDCGEGTGTAVDKERDMPLCAEIEIRDRSRVTGYLLLLVGTEKRGLLKDGLALYFGYLERRGTTYDFKRLSDLLMVK